MITSDSDLKLTTDSLIRYFHQVLLERTGFQVTRSYTDEGLVYLHQILKNGVIEILVSNDLGATEMCDFVKWYFDNTTVKRWQATFLPDLILDYLAIKKGKLVKLFPSVK
jgi:hypothetical protein